MLAKNTTIEQLEKALQTINQRYDNNVCWNRAPERIGKQLRFTLRVKSSKGRGAKLSYSAYSNTRRTCSACWHVHGDFFDTLLDIEPSAVISSHVSMRPIKIYKDSAGVVQGNWKDWNIGSLAYPIDYSESCLCDEWRD